MTRRRTTWAGIAILAGLPALAGLAGCGGEPRTIVTAAAVGTPTMTGPDLEFGPAPEASDAAAAALVVQALAAHTDGQPDRIARTDLVEITLTGKFLWTDGQPHTATNTLTLVWPDRGRSVFELPDNGGQTDGFIRNGDDAWRFASSQGRPVPEEVPILPGYESVVANEMAAHWFLILRPMASSTAVFAPTPAVSYLGKSLTGVKVWLPGFPPTAVYFDPETHRTARIVYEDRENGQRVLKRFDLRGEVVTDGVTYPESVVESANGRVRGDWQQMAVEFPDQVDPALFKQP